MSSHLTQAELIRDEVKKYHIFLNLAIFLGAITAIEIVIIFLPISPNFAFWSLIALSIIKFTGVISWFMHLIYDNVFLTLVFLSGLAIAGGTAIALLVLFVTSDVDYNALASCFSYPSHSMFV